MNFTPSNFGSRLSPTARFSASARVIRGRMTTAGDFLVLAGAFFAFIGLSYVFLHWKQALRVHPTYCVMNTSFPSASRKTPSRIGSPSRCWGDCRIFAPPSAILSAIASTSSY